MQKVVQVLLLLVRLLVGYIFINAGIVKLVDGFSITQVEMMLQYASPSFLSQMIVSIFAIMAPITAIVLPYVEILLGLFILAGLFSRSTAVLILGMVSSFLIMGFWGTDMGNGFITAMMSNYAIVVYMVLVIVYGKVSNNLGVTRFIKNEKAQQF